MYTHTRHENVFNYMWVTYYDKYKFDRHGQHLRSLKNALLCVCVCVCVCMYRTVNTLLQATHPCFLGWGQLQYKYTNPKPHLQLIIIPEVAYTGIYSFSPCFAQGDILVR